LSEVKPLPLFVALTVDQLRKRSLKFDTFSILGDFGVVGWISSRRVGEDEVWRGDEAVSFGVQVEYGEKAMLEWS
jgi:hypothetical protein